MNVVVVALGAAEGPADARGRFFAGHIDTHAVLATQQLIVLH